MSYALEVAAIVKAKMQGRHASGMYAVAGHPAETKKLSDGKRALPLHRAIQQPDDAEQEGDCP